MKTLRYSLFVLFFAGLSFTASAQNYSSAIGVRLGVPISASFKTFISENSAIEGIVGYRSRKVLGFGYTQLNILGLYQIHNDLSSVSSGLQWYYGAGAGVYIYSFDNGFNFAGEDDGNLGIGLSGNLGLEYVFDNTPICISADWIPTFFINGYGSGFGAGYGAFSIRYILGR